VNDACPVNGLTGRRLFKGTAIPHLWLSQKCKKGELLIPANYSYAITSQRKAYLKYPDKGVLIVLTGLLRG
jgi:hypothetical protein